MSDNSPSTPSWFTQFHGFTYDPPAGVRSNFRRLAEARRWGDALRKKRWVECQVTQFGNLWGTDTTKLETWQALCREVYIKNPPESIKGCKKALGSRNVLVNLVNLIDHRETGAKVIRFQDYEAFWKYTKKGCMFPLREAKEDGFIRALLRKL